MLITISFKSEEGPVMYDVSVMGFNTRNFQSKHSYNEHSIDMIKWAAMDSSDIKCIQEYITNSRWKPEDVARQFTNQGYDKFEYFAERDDPDKNQGLAIFSKYKILDSGYVWHNYGSLNAGIFIDIKLGQDTLRI
jgi:exonuclease III